MSASPQNTPHHGMGAGQQVCVGTMRSGLHWQPLLYLLYTRGSSASHAVRGCPYWGAQMSFGGSHLPLLLPLLALPEPCLSIDQVACDEQGARLQAQQHSPCKSPAQQQLLALSSPASASLGACALGTECPRALRHEHFHKLLNHERLCHRTYRCLHECHIVCRW